MTLQIDDRKLRIAMATAGLDTLQALGARAGIHPSTISNLADGKGFRSETLEAIALALDVNPVDLLKVGNGQTA